MSSVQINDILDTLFILNSHNLRKSEIIQLLTLQLTLEQHGFELVPLTCGFFSTDLYS